MSKRLKVLVAAYACSPYHGTEFGVGWGWSNAISKYHDVHVITADFHRADIERASRERPELFVRLNFFYVQHRPWHYAPTKGWSLIEGSFLKPIMNYAYGLWQRDAYKLARKLHEENKFDLAHQLTYVGFRFPGHLWKLDIPFVWGPIGGLENTPWKFLPGLGFSGCVYYAGRNIVNSLQKKFLSGPKKAFCKGRGGIIAATEGIRKEILRWYGEESDVICEIGPPSTTAADHSVRAPGEPLRISWSGQHLPGKALPLLLEAMKMLPVNIDWRLDILGNGPCRKKWQRLALKLGINTRCAWHGFIPRAEAIKIVHDSHIFVITSLKDLTSTVLLEALSQGVPVVCPDHCGFSSVVTDDCGVKVPVISPGQIKSDLAAAITRLDRDENERQRLAAGALTRTDVFSWEGKAARIDALYRRVAFNHSACQNI